ncbi:MAG: hypothetical protein J7K36_09870, partial [Archaeoglobaceae archaeon]|nr:hypothetical protein [Archaeoglobaceae archaeon]
YTIMIALKAMYPIPNYPSYIGNLISFGFLAYLVYEYFDIYHKKQFSKYREIVKKNNSCDIYNHSNSIYRL